MPPSNLPSHAKDIYMKAEANAKKSTCKDAGDRQDECAAKVAWAAVKNKYKKVGEKWVLKSDHSFDMKITRASLDKATGEMRVKAVASDTEDDSYGDNMTLELFEDFVDRIENNEPAPDPFRSEFWSGGMPYVSISHYDDMEGEAVPGEIKSTYIDGEYLKSLIVLEDSPLGRACFRSICDDLYGKNPPENKVRISIGFLDWQHRHKSNNVVFNRTSIYDECPECLSGNAGVSFLRGQLVHEAFTRVPVNERTSIEVDRSMESITRKQDAASIIGEELADDLEEKAQMNRAALVIKSEGEEETPVEEERSYHSDKQDDEEEDSKKKDKKKKDEEMKSEALQEEADLEETVKQKKESWGYEPSSSYLVVEDPNKPTTWHLPIKKNGKISRGLLGAAKAALTSNHRGHSYSGSGKSKAISKLKRVYKQRGLKWESFIALSEIFEENREELIHMSDLYKTLSESVSAILEDESIENKSEAVQESIQDFKDEVELRALSLQPEPQKKTPPSDALEAAFAEFRAAYTNAVNGFQTEQDRLVALNEPVEKFVVSLRSMVKESVGVSDGGSEDRVDRLEQSMTQMAASITALTELYRTGQAPEGTVPQRRSIGVNPMLPVTHPSDNGKPNSIHAIARKSVGLG